MSNQLSESFFSIPISTYRERGSLLTSSSSLLGTSFHNDDNNNIIDSATTTTTTPFNEIPFPYSMIISAISILFFRTTIHQHNEPRSLRWFFATLLSFLTYSNKSYELICAVELFSYAVPFLLYSKMMILDHHHHPWVKQSQQQQNQQQNDNNHRNNDDKTIMSHPTTTTTTTRTTILPLNSNAIRIGLIVLSGIVCLISCHVIANGTIFHTLSIITPTFVMEGLEALFPIQEVLAAYNTIDVFIYEQGLLQSQVARLLFITFHIQVGIGYLGIDFLKREQERRNQLVRMDMVGTTADDDSDDDENDNDDDNDDNNNGSRNFTTTQTNEDGKTGSNNNTRSNNPTTTTPMKRKKKQTMNDKMMKQSLKFQRTAAPFIFFTAVPYMLEVIAYGNLNAFAYMCFHDDVHRAVRLYDLFDHDNNLVALAAHSAKSPAGTYVEFIYVHWTIMYRRKKMGMNHICCCSWPRKAPKKEWTLDDVKKSQYFPPHIHSCLYIYLCSSLDFAGFIDTVVSTTYELFNRKLFSLPKVVLLPVVMGRQPKMIAQLFPVIFLTDWMKGRVVSYMTNRMEQLQKEMQELNAIRAKVEQFDMKHAELLQRAGPGATDFTRRRWQDLTVRVQMKKVVSDLTARTKGFFAFIQRNFVFSVLVDCALAQLIAVGKLVSSDIFVISRAIEDAVDMVLMRSRSEAELARMMTHIDNLKELAQVWQSAQDRNVLPCNIAPPEVKDHSAGYHSSLVVLRNLLYSRGTASVRIDHLELPAGVYALTGANGSGKSTLFRVLMSCNTNDRPIDLPPSIVLSTPNTPLIEEDDVQREVSCEAADETIESSPLPPNDRDKSGDRELTPSSHSVAQTEISAEGATTTITTTTTTTAATGYEQGKAKATNEVTHPRLSITMPSSHVAEISQTFYWPLYSKPIEWIYQHHLSDSLSAHELDERTRKVAELLHSLEFTQSLEPGVEDPNKESNETEELTDGSANDAIDGIMKQLVEEKEDWFGDLSGGQKSKVELVRKVFLLDKCPSVLLIDETMAPLDPRSKSLVMAQLKAFCSDSVVIVIYHTDVGRESEDEGGDLVECVPSNDFFDGNIHVENKVMHLRPVC